MKAEHRKQLETNTLADKIGGFVDSFKEGPSRNAIVYGTVIVVVLLLILIYRWVSGNATSNDSDRWRRWGQVATREELDTFIKEYPDTEQGRLAQFELARLDLVEGQRDLDSPLDRAGALKKVQRAADAYEELAGKPANSPQLNQEALLNAARARETLGQFDRAKEWYDRLARDYPNSLKAKDAGEQVKALDSSGAVLEELKQLAKEREPAGGPPAVPTPPAAP